DTEDIRVHTRGERRVVLDPALITREPAGARCRVGEVEVPRETSPVRPHPRFEHHFHTERVGHAREPLQAFVGLHAAADGDIGRPPPLEVVRDERHGIDAEARQLPEHYHCGLRLITARSLGRDTHYLLENYLSL